jgi:uncharacterized membrane protein YfcA
MPLHIRDQPPAFLPTTYVRQDSRDAFAKNLFTTMDAPHLLIIATVLFGGSLLQGTVGFGFALFAVPLLLATGLPMPMVLAVNAISTAVQAGNGVHHLRADVPWREMGLSIALRAGAMLIGIWVLAHLMHYPQTLLNCWIGVMVLAMTATQALWRPRPQPRLHAGWGIAAFLMSGFIGGICSMSGPPLVLWALAHDWSVARTRAFLFASFLLLIPLQLAVLYATFGSDVLRGMLLGLLLCPAVLLGSHLGLRLGARFSKPLLCNAAYTVLVVIAATAILPRFLR